MNTMTDPGWETPAEDVAEQSADAFGEDDEQTQNPPELSVETPEWDAQEQSQVVRGEDEYR
jgi:hypothetical protein